MFLKEFTEDEKREEYKADFVLVIFFIDEPSVDDDNLLESDNPNTDCL